MASDTGPLVHTPARTLLLANNTHKQQRAYQRQTERSEDCRHRRRGALSMCVQEGCKGEREREREKKQQQQLR